MNASTPPARRIASNLLWTPQGLVRDPLLVLAPDGRIRSVSRCTAPDRLAATEFYAGLLVADFPADYRTAFARLCQHPETPLDEQLRRLVPASPGLLVVLSGLDYPSLRLTAQSQIHAL